MDSDGAKEWLEADGLGGFASGTVDGLRTRRYHALLLCATTPPTGRMVLVNGIEAWAETNERSYALTSQRYHPDVLHPDGHRRIIDFRHEPWPKWRYRLEDGTEIDYEVIVRHGTGETLLSWRRVKGQGPLHLHVRPLLSGRDYHALHRENSGFDFSPHLCAEAIVWTPYPGVPAIVATTNATYRHEPVWYRKFVYVEEQQRGLDCIEDLASPGTFTWDLGEQEAVLILRAGIGRETGPNSDQSEPAADSARRIRDDEARRRTGFPSALDRAADAYVVQRGGGKTIVAGYPWFTDWGRDTFIAMRGLCLARGQLDAARDMLLAWADTVSQGMLPNLFPDGASEPEYNSVDASLWYVIAVHEYLAAAEAARASGGVAEKLRKAVEAVVEGYAAGTRFGIRMDADGLLAAGVPGVQLTWMDAKIGDWVVTPRIGKPVEVQALWLNALRIVGQWAPNWKAHFERGLASFRRRFWREDAGCLHDVVDVDHVAGRTDSSFRPNQIFAVGGLPYAVLDGQPARRVVDEVESKLLTPLGLRSLAPGSEGYRPRYEGGVWERDSAYHQGTVWPWLMGPFVEAWLRVRGHTAAAKTQARERFLTPLLEHLNTAGLGHVSEIADAEPSHTPRGCPFQAWSLGELLRILKSVCGADEPFEAKRVRRKTMPRAAASR
jgi:predicted glycogen debranching enzyme